MADKTCPLGHTCASCLWHTQLRGMNPQTGAEIDEYACAVAWLPILLIENAQKMHGTAQAVESFRNAMVRDNGALGGMMQNLLERPQ